MLFSVVIGKAAVSSHQQKTNTLFSYPVQNQHSKYCNKGSKWQLCLYFINSLILWHSLYAPNFEKKLRGNFALASITYKQDIAYNMALDTTKHVFGFSYKVRLKPGI